MRARNGRTRSDSRRGRSGHGRARRRGSRGTGRQVRASRRGRGGAERPGAAHEMSAASSRGRCRGDNVSNEGESDDRATAGVESRKKDAGLMEPRAVTGTLNSARDLTSGIGGDGPSQGVRSAAMRRACRRAHEARTKRALAAKEEKGRQAQFASLENFIAEADRGVRRDRHVEEKDAALKKRRRARRERELARRGGARRPAPC